VRLSRSRLALRAALLAVGGAYLAWRAVVARRAAAALGGSDALLGSWLALVWLLVGVLALLTAVAITLSLRRKPPQRTLHLRDLHGGDGSRAHGRPPPDRASGSGE
jgi:membrane protein implicated in regulation of membrane protease activity